MFKLDIEQAEEPEIILPTSVGSSKKQESYRKTSTLLTTPKPLCGSQQTVENSEMMGIPSWPASWETYMQVRKQQLELNMEQQTGSKLGKEYIKAACCHPAYLTYMKSTSCEILA